MANRDKSQKVGFIYTNIYQIYKKAKDAPESPIEVTLQRPAPAAAVSSSSRVIHAEDLGNFKVTKFQPATLAKPLSSVSAASELPKKSDAVSPFDDLKGNINKLQDLHSRLRFMLKELEDLVKKK